MNAYLLKILSVSFSGTIVAALIFLMQLLFRKHLSHTWRYYVWIIVLIRLLLPFAPAQNIADSAVRAVHLNEAAPTNNIGGAVQTPYVDDTQYMNNFLPDDMVSDDLPEKAAAQSGVWAIFRENLLLLWFAVCLLLAVRKISGYLRFIKNVQAGSVLLSEAKVLAVYHEVCKEMGIGRPPQVYTNESIVTPMLAGVFHPMILLPGMEFTKEQLGFVFRHELTHHKRKDILYKWLLVAVSCLHWFNPAFI